MSTNEVGPVSSIPFLNTALSPIKQIQPTSFNTCVLSDTTGQVTCWGSGTSGVNGLGNGASPTSLTGSSPILFAQPTITVTQISGRSDFICALFTNGGVRCWGVNSLGQVKRKKLSHKKN